ncbi:MAG TPA: HAMP domain-containing sensor histidine kinase [bacterium]|nr:HAMP domain-containing sensor histidine kinase [bacterium]
MNAASHAISIRALGFDTDTLEYRHPDGTYRCTVRHVEGAIFHLTQEGYVDEGSILKMIGLFRDIRTALDKVFGIKACVIINEIPKITGGSLLAKRHLKAQLSAWPGVHVFTVGARGMVRIIDTILARLTPSVSMHLVDSLDEALSSARQCDPARGLSDETPPQRSCGSLPEPYRDRLELLLETIGRISWDNGLVPVRFDIPPDDPFHDLFAALTTMHNDILEIFARSEKNLLEAEEANRRKDRLIADVSHELRSPLTSIIVMSDMLALARDPQEARRYADQIRETALRMNRIIEDILSNALVGAGKGTVTSCRFDLAEQIAPLLDQFAMEASRKGIAFEKTVPGGALPVQGDPLKVLQIVTNLLSNAVKYTDTGKVKVAIAVQDIDGRARKAFIEVSDTGIGISEEDQAHLFSRFSRTPATASRRGIGLGLSIAHELACLMGGDIAVKSTPGKGSTFIFSFPFILDGSCTVVTPKEESGKSDTPSTRATTA